MDLEDLDYVLSTLKLLGSKGTTGTQASFLELFDGDQSKVDQIDPLIAKKMGFSALRSGFGTDVLQKNGHESFKRSGRNRGQRA